MARFNKAKNFAGKSYVVSNEIESLINSLSFEGNILKFGATTIGGDTVALGNGVDFSTWINDAKTAATAAAVGTANDAATVATVYGAKKYTDEATAAVIGTAEDTKDSDTIKGAKLYAKSVADAVSAAAIGVAEGDGIAIVLDDKTKVHTISTDIKLVSDTNTGDYASVYDLQIADATNGGYKSVGKINIPKDQFLKNAVYEDGSIKLTFAVEGKGDVVTSIDVKDLIDTYTAAADATEIQLSVDNNVFSATIVDGAVITAKIDDDAVTTAKIADANVTAVKLSADAKALFDAAGVAGQALTDAKAYTDAEIDKLDGSAVIATVAGDVVTLKAGITETDGIVDQSAGDDIVLAKVAKTGKAADVTVADTENVIIADNVEDALVEIAKEIDAMDATTAADATAEDTSAIAGVQVVKSITQVDGKLTEIATAKADKFGSANKALADAKTYTDKVIAAVNAKAVQFMSAELTLSATTTSGTVNGRVIAVYGADGGQVYPEITFADNVSTINVEGLTASETFTVIYATTITVAND